MNWEWIGVRDVSDLIIIIMNDLVVKRSEPGRSDSDSLSVGPVVEVVKLGVVGAVIVLGKPIPICGLIIV